MASVLARRVAGQHLAGNGLAAAVDVVRALTCVQSQEWAHGFWSLGMRTAGLTYPQVQAEFDAGTFVRTHILRPTWHYVAAEDLRWIQAVTAPRVQQLNGTIYRREGLGERELDRAVSMIISELAGHPGRTRAELGRVRRRRVPAGVPDHERRAGGGPLQRADPGRAAHLRPGR